MLSANNRIFFDIASLFANIRHELALSLPAFQTRTYSTCCFSISKGKIKMKNYACLLLLGSALSISASAFAENRAVNISIGSIGGALDEAAVQTVRQVIGHAVANKTVDKFIVNSPGAGLPIPVEGNLSLCAEAGFNTDDAEFDAFIDQLHSISPKAGTFYNVELAPSCGTADNGNVGGGSDSTFCTMDVKMCPDGSYVSRQPPSCQFAPCPVVTR
jgi:hypothetical protein